MGLETNVHSSPRPTHAKPFFFQQTFGQHPAFQLDYTIRVIRIDGGETTLFDETTANGLDLDVLGINTLQLDEGDGDGFSLDGLTGANLNGSTWRVEFIATVNIGSLKRICRVKKQKHLGC